MTENPTELEQWAAELGCTQDELLSAMGETGRSLFETPAEQFEFDFGLAA